MTGTTQIQSRPTAWMWEGREPSDGHFTGGQGVTIIRPTSSPYPSNLVVSGLTGLITSVILELNGLSHVFPDDLEMVLVSPTGQSLKFWSDAGGNASISALNITINHSAVNPLPDAGPLASGPYLPADHLPSIDDTMPAPCPAPNIADLTGFNGFNPNGTWTLYIFDDQSLDDGSLTSWGLQFTTA